MTRSGASRGWLLVAFAAIATVAVAWFLIRPQTRSTDTPEGGAPVEPAANEVAEAEHAAAGPAPTPGGAAVSVWKTQDGALHFGDDPPPASQELGTVTANDARALAAARPAEGEAPKPDRGVEELMRRIRQDTARRPIAGPMGDPTWSVRDIEGIVVGRDSMDVATDWVTNQTMIRVAQRLCRYVSAQGDAYEPRTVVVRGRHGRILARCSAVG
ncbi:MAG: hypothetical protein ACREQJ_03000 [Candidatus Binatia bacterium]